MHISWWFGRVVSIAPTVQGKSECEAESKLSTLGCSPGSRYFDILTRPYFKWASASVIYTPLLVDPNSKTRHILPTWVRWKRGTRRVRTLFQFESAFTPRDSVFSCTAQICFFIWPRRPSGWFLRQIVGFFYICIIVYLSCTRCITHQCFTVVSSSL